MAKKKKWGMTVVCLIAVLMGFCLGVFLSWATERLYGEDYSTKQTLLTMVVMLLLFYLFMLVQLILHEAGHLVCGLLSGYTFSSFRIFNFMWVKLEGKIRLKRLSLAGTAGQCLLVPPELKNGKIPVVFYNLGGVLMNSIASALAIVIAILCWQNIYVVLPLMIFAIVGFLLGLTNGIPLRTGQVSNDGANILALRKDGRAMRAFWLQVKINSEIAKGMRVKDMPKEWFVPVEEGNLENCLVATQAVLRANYLMDAHEFFLAKAEMQELLQKETGILGVHKNLMLCDLTYLALLEKNEGGAQALWTKELTTFMRSMKNFPSVLRTQYAYALLVEKDEAKATKLRQRFEEVAKKYPYASDIQSERELLSLINSEE